MNDNPKVFCCREHAVRFWTFVKRGAKSECWPWTHSLTTWGYGECTYAGKRSNASRVAYIMEHGEIAPGLVVCHSCDNPACCNPAHLWVGTPGDNVRDCNAKGRGRSHFASDNHPRYSAKLTPEQVREARRLHHESGVTQSEIARRMGVRPSTINRLVRGERWRHVT